VSSIGIIRVELRISVTIATVFNGVLDVTYKSDVSLVPIKGQLQLKFNQIYTMSTNKDVHDTTLCDKISELFATDWGFLSGYSSFLHQ
jgi:hypothetical protein